MFWALRSREKSHPESHPVPATTMQHATTMQQFPEGGIPVPVFRCRYSGVFRCRYSGIPVPATTMQQFPEITLSPFATADRHCRLPTPQRSHWSQASQNFPSLPIELKTKPLARFVSFTLPLAQRRSQLILESGHAVVPAGVFRFSVDRALPPSGLPPVQFFHNRRLTFRRLFVF